MSKKDSKRVLLHRFDWTPFLLIIFKIILYFIAFGLIFVLAF